MALLQEPFSTLTPSRVPQFMHRISSPHQALSSSKVMPQSTVLSPVPPSMEQASMTVMVLQTNSSGMQLQASSAVVQIRTTIRRTQQDRGSHSTAQPSALTEPSREPCWTSPRSQVPFSTHVISCAPQEHFLFPEQQPSDQLLRSAVSLTPSQHPMVLHQERYLRLIAADSSVGAQI